MNVHELSAHLWEHADAWHLAGVGGGRAADGSLFVLVGHERGEQPHPELVAWRASLEHPEAVRIEEYGQRPGEGPDVDTPEGMQGVAL